MVHFGYLILDIPPHMAVQVESDVTVGTDDIFAFPQVYQQMFVAATAEGAGNGKSIFLHGYLRLLWQNKVYPNSAGKANPAQISPVCAPFFLTRFQAEPKMISY